MKIKKLLFVVHLKSPINEPPSWTLRIEGKLIEDIQYPGKSPKFSSFFKKLFVQLDKTTYPSNWYIEWDKYDTLGDYDGFEIKRTGSTETIVHIFLQLDQGKYKVNPVLLTELGLPLRTYSKTAIILSLWQYARNNKLQEPSTPSKINSNVALKSILGVASFTYPDIPKLLQEHLGPPDPIQLFYKIRTQGPVIEQCYEFSVDVPNPLPPFNTDPNRAEIDKIDEQIHALIQQIKSHKEDIRSLEEFASDPVTAIEEHIASNM